MISHHCPLSLAGHNDKHVGKNEKYLFIKKALDSKPLFFYFIYLYIYILDEFMKLIPKKRSQWLPVVPSSDILQNSNRYTTKSGAYTKKKGKGTKKIDVEYKDIQCKQNGSKQCTVWCAFCFEVLALSLIYNILDYLMFNIFIVTFIADLFPIVIVKCHSDYVLYFGNNVSRCTVGLLEPASRRALLGMK